MKLRILIGLLAVAAVLAVASPASAQVIVSPGYSPYSGTVVVPRASPFQRAAEPGGRVRESSLPVPEAPAVVP